ncbi:MAG: hypothetical protein KKB50_19305 [Planctomycetes bacterium]|nr:hypothetical protein [Planctomycetota bacterium]
MVREPIGVRTGRFGLAVLAVALLLLSPAVAQRGDVVATLATADGYRVSYTATFTEDDLIFGRSGDFDVLTIPGGTCLTEVGLPMLPAVQLRLALPQDMAVTSINVGSAEQYPLVGEFMVYPAQPPRPVSDPANAQDFVSPDPAAYASSVPYPARQAEFSCQTDLAGQNIAIIRLYPVQYVASEQRLTLCTSLSVELEGVTGYECGDYLPLNVSQRGLDSYDQMVRDMVVNPQDVDLRSAPLPPPQTIGVGAGDYDYVIIAQSSWVDDFQPLADWKTKKGVPATIVTTDWIYNSGGYSGTNLQKIRAFVQDARNTWGATYFLLGGDTDTIPAHSRTFSSVDPEAVPNDTYYADYDGDWTCEVHVGRASVRTTTAIDTFIDKVFTYEKNPPLTDYAKTAFFCGFDLDSYTDGEDTKIDIYNDYLPSGWTYRREYDSESGAHRTDVIGYLNQGNNLVNHIDHCNEYVLGVGYTNHGESLSTSDVDNLNNGDRQSIFYTLGCWPCAFDYSACIAEHYVRDTNGGGVAFVGNTRYGWYYQGYDDYLSARFDRYFFRSLWSQGHYTLGECFSDHKNDSYENEDIYQYIFTELTLLGDPELQIWSENPSSLNVTHASTLNAGENTAFPVDVYSGGSPVNLATVCLWKDGDVYEIALTNTSGQATFWFAPGSAGTMYVTADKRNYIPYEGQAEVIAGTMYTLTVNTTGQGTVALDPPGGSYAENTTVELTASGSTGWHFDHWEGNLSGSDNPETILMNGNKTVTAVFVQDEYTLTVNTTGQGSVVLDPPGGTYSYGTSVDLTAQPATKWCFDHWSGALSGSDNPETLYMDGNKSVTAVFAEDCNENGIPDSQDIAGEDLMVVFDLSSYPAWSTEGDWAFGQPTGGGGEYGGPDPTGGHTDHNVYGYNLYGDYENNLPERHLTTTAIDCSGATNVHLTFWRWLGVEDPQYDHAYVRVSNDGNNWTTVWQNTAEIADTWWTYQDLDISAVADNQPTVLIRWTMGTTDGGWRFCGWNIDDIVISGTGSGGSSEDCNENGVPDECDIDEGTSTDLNENGIPDECEAQYSLTVNISGQGAVALDPPGGAYPPDTSVQLTANAQPSWSFDHWTGALSGSNNPETLLVDGNKTVTAVFVENTVEYTLTIGSTPVNGVSIQVSPSDNYGQGNGVTQFERSYDAGANVTLTAPVRPTVAGSELTLCHWEVDGAAQADEEPVLDHTVGDDIGLVAVYLMVGDMNADGAVNGFDIDLFIVALDNQAGFEATYGPCRLRAADTNGDGAVNGFDIDSFIDLLD